MANYTQFAIPGLMTPHAPNFKKNIITDESGNLIILLHSGVSTDRVNYCLIVGGNRREGVVKDPTYPYVNGLDGREMDRNRFNKAPDFAYKTTDLPDEVFIPKVNVKGCPIPITELNKAQDKTYFILKLPRTALPVGDSVIQVSINGKIRQYIVQRPAFYIHVPQHKDISNKYNIFSNTPDFKFNVELCQDQDSTIEIDLMRTREMNENYTYSASLIDIDEAIYVMNVDWSEDNSKILVDIPAALPAGHYGLLIAYKHNEDEEQSYKLTKGYVEIKEHEVIQLQAESEGNVPVQLDYDVPESILNNGNLYAVCTNNNTKDSIVQELYPDKTGISFMTPQEQGSYTLDFYFYSIKDKPVKVITLDLTII